MTVIALPIIIVSLVCLVPWAVFAWIAVISDAAARRNPGRDDVEVRAAEPDVAEFQLEHDWLVELGFEPLGIAENPHSPRRTREWLYHHPEVPFILASLSFESHIIIVEFATRFEGLAVVTMTGEMNLNIDTPDLIVNTVESGIAPALQYHQQVIETQYAEHGEPLRLFTADDYLSWINDFDVVYRENSYFVRVNQRMRLAAFLTAAASCGGLVGLDLMHRGLLADGLVIGLAVIMAVSAGLLIRWILRPPWEGLSVEERLTQQTTVES